MQLDNYSREARKEAVERRTLNIGDSPMAIGSFSQGWSSQPLLSHALRRRNENRLSMGLRLAVRHIRPHRNQMDAPSRGTPFGTNTMPELSDNIPPEGVNCFGCSTCRLVDTRLMAVRLRE